MLMLAALIALIVSMALVLLRGILGPTLHDRILAANGFGSNTVVMIALLGYVVDNNMFIDIALVYGLVNYLATVAILKFFCYGRFDADQDMIAQPVEQIEERHNG